MRVGQHRDVIWFIATMILVLGLFVPLLNPYWVPVSDSDAYLAMARSVARGQGVRFNNQPVAVVPPGWPILLGAAMKLSGSFLSLKLVLLGGMMIFLAAMWWVIRQTLPAWQTSLAIVLSALIYEISRHVYTFHAEPAFGAMLGVILLLAIAVHGWRDGSGERSERRETDGRAGGRAALAASVFPLPPLLPLLLLLLTIGCVLLVTIRWAAVLTWPIVAAILLQGELFPRLSRRWIAAALSAVGIFATFLALRAAVRVERSQLDPLYAHNLAMPDRPRVASFSDRVDRILHSGVWLTDLLWEGAARASQRFQPLGHTGLIGLALVVIAAIDGVWRRRWLGLAILGYMMVLIWIWPRPVARYFVPIAPLLIAEMFAGAAVLMRWLMSRRQGGLHVGTNLAIGCVAGSILLCSVAPYMNQVAQQRASNFYASFRGGAFQSLVNVAYKLHELNAPAGSIAMSRLEFVGRDQQKSTNSYLRAAIFVTDRPIRVLPPSLMAQPTRRLIGWSQRANVQYSLYQQRRRIVTRAAAATSISTSSAATAPIVRVRHGPPEWSIVTVHRGRLRHVPLQQIENWPRHVPGLSKARAGSR